MSWGRPIVFIVFGVLVPVVFIILFAYGLVVTNAQLSSIGWAITAIVILCIWIGWFLFIKKVSHDLNDPQQSFLMDEQVKLLPFLNRKDFKVKQGEEWRFQTSVGSVLGSASRIGAVVATLFGILVYIVSNVGLNPEIQKNIILFGGYLVIIGFVVFLIREQKGSK